jgi:hypothetical protein
MNGLTWINWISSHQPMLYSNSYNYLFYYLWVQWQLSPKETLWISFFFFFKWSSHWFVTCNFVSSKWQDHTSFVLLTWYFFRSYKKEKYYCPPSGLVSNHSKCIYFHQHQPFSQIGYLPFHVVLCRWQVCALNLTGVHVFYFIYFLIFLNKYSWNLQLYNIYKYISKN